jgi:hypothetical protein
MNGVEVMIDLGVPEASETLEDIFERQDGVASVAQAIAAGTSRRQVWRRRRSGRYRRCRRNVVQLAGVPPTWRQAIRIASIAAGERVVVSHASAARLYDVELPRAVHPRWARDGRFIEVAAPLAQHIRMAGVRGHRSGMWAPGDVEEHHGIPITSPLRLVIDMSSRLGVEGTGKLVDQLLRRGLLETRQLRERVESLRPAPGRSVRVLRLVVAARCDDVDAAGSSPEPSSRRADCRDRLNEPVGRRQLDDGGFEVRVDLADPAVELVVEGGGFGLRRYASDVERDGRARTGLAARGRIGLYITWR